MKTLPKHTNFVYSIYLPIFFIGLILLYFFPQQMLVTFRAHWLILISLMVLALSPLGKIKLGTAQAPVKFSIWLALILIAEIGISLVYWGLSFISLQALPILSQRHPELLKSTGQHLLWSWGFYPWPLFILIAIALAYVGFYKNQPGQLSNVLKPLLKNVDEDATSLTVDFFMRWVALYSLAATVGIVCLQLVIIFSQLFQIPIITGLQLNTMVLATLLIFLINSRAWQQTVRFLSTKNLAPSLIVAIFIPLIAFTVFILNFIMIKMTGLYPMMKQNLLALSFKDWSSYWQIFTNLWFMTWLPLVAGLIAFLSRGYTIRKVVFGGLLAMIIPCGIIWSLTQTAVIENPHWILWNDIAPLLGAAMIFSLLLRTRYLIYQNRAVVPGTQPQKFRSLHFYNFAILQIAVFIIILYLPAGILTVNVMTLAIVFPLAILAGIAGLAFIKMLVQ